MTAPVTRPARNHQDGLAMVIPLSSVFNAYASCTVTCDTNANMADGDTVTINDGITSTVYEYDKSANGVAAGHVAWAAGTTADTVALALQTAIQATQTCLTVTDNGSGVLTLTNKIPGQYTNGTNAKSSSSALAVTNFTGGNGVNAIAGTSTAKLWKNGESRTVRLAHASINSVAGFTANVSAYWTITLQNGSTVLATWSTKTTTGGGNGSLVANTPTELVISTSHTDLLSGDVLSLVLTPTGSPAAFPLPAILTIEALDL